MRRGGGDDAGEREIDTRNNWSFGDAIGRGAA
jgi:hypothetical protein